MGLIGIVASCVVSFGFGGAVGVGLMGVVSGHKIIAARADAAKFKNDFNRAVREIAEALEERDRLRSQIKAMTPMFDLGHRRSQAVKKANGKRKGARAAGNAAA